MSEQRVLIDDFTVDTHKRVYVAETAPGHIIKIDGKLAQILGRKVWRNGTCEWTTTLGTVFYRAPWTNEHKPDDEKQPSTLDGEGIGFAVNPFPSPRQARVLKNIADGESNRIIRPEREYGYGLFQLNTAWNR